MEIFQFRIVRAFVFVRNMRIKRRYGDVASQKGVSNTQIWNFRPTKGPVFVAGGNHNFETSEFSRHFAIVKR